MGQRFFFAAFSLLLMQCHHVRRPTPEMLQTLGREVSPPGCIAPDEATIVFDKAGAPYVMDVARGELRWQGEPESVVACYDAGLLVARPGGNGLRVALRDYRSGAILHEVELEPEGCIGGAPFFQPWPRGELIGLRWEGHRYRRNGGTPPTPEEEAYWNACDGQGGVWLDPSSGRWSHSERVREADRSGWDWQDQTGSLRVEVHRHEQPIPDGCGGNSFDFEVRLFRGDEELWRHVLQSAEEGSAAESCIP